MISWYSPPLPAGWAMAGPSNSKHGCGGGATEPDAPQQRGRSPTWPPATSSTAIQADASGPEAELVGVEATARARAGSTRGSISASPRSAAGAAPARRAGAKVRRRQQQQRGERIAIHTSTPSGSSTSSIPTPAASASGRTGTPSRRTAIGQAATRARARAAPRTTDAAADGVERQRAGRDRGGRRGADDAQRAEQNGEQRRGRANGAAHSSVHRSSARLPGAGARARAPSAARISGGSSSVPITEPQRPRGDRLALHDNPVCIAGLRSCADVERVDGAEHGAPEALEAGSRSQGRPARVRVRRRPARAPWDAGGVQRALFADGQREREMGELAERARRAGIEPRPLL